MSKQTGVQMTLIDVGIALAASPIKDVGPVYCVAVTIEPTAEPELRDVVLFNLQDAAILAEAIETGLGRVEARQQLN